MNRIASALQKRSYLIGMGCYTYDPVFVDILAGLGFDALWIELEHCHISFAQAADLCRIASGQGLLTMIRIPDSSRENVLKAAECGPDIIDLPMANTPETIAEMVRHARYAPSGQRGFFGASRAVNYGLDPDCARTQELINEQLCLMAQLETREAVERAEELCAVTGLDAVFIGAGDLSASLGVPGQTDHTSVLEAIELLIDCAKRHSKLLAIATSPRDAMHWVSKGVRLVFAGSNVGCLKNGARNTMAEIAASRIDLPDPASGNLPAEQSSDSKTATAEVISKALK